jgi:hypothetical protein
LRAWFFCSIPAIRLGPRVVPIEVTEVIAAIGLADEIGVVWTALTPAVVATEVILPIPAA